MSTARAKRLLGGIRFHHLGFGFFWAVSFVVLSGLQAHANSGEYWRAYLLVEQVVTFLAVGGVAWVYRKKTKVLPSWLSLLSGFMLSGGALLYFLSFYLDYGGLFISLCSGLFIGCANALFFLLWQTFFVTEGQQRAIIYIPLSAVLSLVLYALVSLLPLPGLIFAVVVVLPFLAMLTLHTSLDEIELYPIKIISKREGKRVFGDLWRPIFCVCAIGFVWKLVAQLSGTSGESNDFAAIAVLVGFGAAALVVALFELFSSRGFDILRMYQILFPLITGIFLLPTFFGSHYNPLLTGMLMFGFEVVNLLLLITCAVYAAKKTYSPLVMYGICVFPTLVAMSAGDMLGLVLNPFLAYDFAQFVDVLFVCIYLLSIVLVFISRGKNRAPATSADEELSLSKDGSTTSPQSQRTIVGYFKEKGLSPREIEVSELLVKGNSVAAMSRKLFISENTIRGHTKSIYKKLNVHSRQELVDMCEAVEHSGE